MKIILSVIIFLCLADLLKAQEQSSGPVMPLFQSDEILHLRLEADFNAVFANHDDSTDFPAIFTYIENNGEQKTIEIKIRTRGNTRRQSDICKFAPLRLDFPKKEVKNSPFEGQNAIKLVTHCDKANHNEQNTILEYLIYKAYNVLTDHSFRVRPAMITYIDSGKKADSLQRFAFFLEREKHLAARLKKIEYETDKVHPARVNAPGTCLVDIFEYMTGNTDYSVYDLHNIILVGDSAKAQDYIPVPYDFDWSGLVFANYAVPNPVIGTEFVTERVYRGIKQDEEIVNTTLDLFRSKKEEIYRLFEQDALLNESEKKKAIKYLDGFYELINNEKRVKTEFFDKARDVVNGER